VQEHLQKAIATLSKNNGLTLIMALSYGSRIEIVEAVRQIAEKVKAGKLDPADITEKVFPTISGRATCPIPTCSSAPAARCA
jgi:undecaprenyl diphosphate synthase